MAKSRGAQSCVTYWGTQTLSQDLSKSPGFLEQELKIEELRVPLCIQRPPGRFSTWCFDQTGLNIPVAWLVDST